MGNLRLGLLPVFSNVAIALSYGINKIDNDNKKDALRKACWWGGIFFAYGAIDYFLLGINSN
jgi:hypothetical protein